MNYVRHSMTFVFAILIFLALQLSWRLPTATAAAPSRLVIGYASTTPRLMPLWIARDQGFFAKYGIESEPVLLRSGATLVTGMASGTSRSDARLAPRYYRRSRRGMT